ncbi:ABC transporter permease [Jejuia spongiicola]|uniref:ABC transporter permease n=1 Tax=Jejuia spongiicola TaxID=2942207 RepID=A0ABT0QH38_9FLAO|nr:ABC transporter permease [Jejuia spongiicola]MCL6296272.1 ABC transporter permease [Jejuia spongiicola]
MGLLKKLTELTSQKGKMDVVKSETKQQEKLTYNEKGKKNSEDCSGNPHNLQSSLAALYQSFENKCKQDIYAQQQLKQPYLAEQKGKKTSLLNKVEELLRFEKKVEEINTEIDNLNQDCRKVKTNPEDYLLDVDKKASAKFWIGISFLLPLAAYIFVFYISTSFSAFFREFDPGISLFQGMFDPQALSKAYTAGWLELVFILFIPFIFFALGYLIHMFQEKRGLINKLKIAALFIITFLFDAILAYLIDQKLYNLNKTFDSEVFNISTAFQSVSFWLIIFAGFVSYIVWGLVFDFVMKEHADRDKIKAFIRSKKEEILGKEKKLIKLKEEISGVEDEISKIKIRTTELQNIIDGFILPVMNYKALSTEYLQGWQHYISSGLRMGKDEKDALLLESRGVYDKHIKNLEIDTDTYQNKVYTKTL